MEFDFSCAAISFEKDGDKAMPALHWITVDRQAGAVNDCS
jgi:hypothetical protein